MSGQHRLAPSPELRKHWLVIRGALVAGIAALVLTSWWLVQAEAGPAKQKASMSDMAAHVGGGAMPPKTAPATTTAPPAVTTPATANAPISLTASGPGWLQSGSDPSVVPGPVLIADGDGNRVLIIDPNGRMMWQFPRAGDLAPGQSFKAPEVAWFSPDGKKVVVASEDTHILFVIDIATHKIVYTYGKMGAPGSGPNEVNTPDGVVMLPSGDLMVPDAGNCRIIQIPAGAKSISRQLGQTGTCAHNPPTTFSDPSGLFPMTNGNLVVTEGVGHYVSEMTPAGKIVWTVKVPGVSAIYQTDEIGPNRYLTVDHVVQGSVLTFDRSGKVLWRYAPTGDQSLNKPSLAIGMPNGDVMISDKVNNRLIVVDPRTNKVVWQYGHTKVPGSGPGFLNNPTGMDLYPPNSIAAGHTAK
jgi:DNA-binding beta-propeller fold protein YncE